MMRLLVFAVLWGLTSTAPASEFGGETIRVQGATKVMGHLMFGILALAGDQLMRLRQ